MEIPKVVRFHYRDSSYLNNRRTSMGVIFYLLKMPPSRQPRALDNGYNGKNQADAHQAVPDDAVFAEQQA